MKTDRLNTGAYGVALAGTNGVGGSFNRVGDGPLTVTRTAEGTYSIEIPGLVNPNSAEFIQSATLTQRSDYAGQISVRWEGCSGYCNGHPVVTTRDTAGNLVDRPFSYLLFGANNDVLNP